jgi:hypothetical protein
MAIGPADASGWLHFFGALMFLGIILSLLRCGRVLGGETPLLAVPLVALNGTVFYFGSSLRAYGLAALLITLCFAAFWRFCREPSRCNGALALILAVLSAHANYQNCYLILGIGFAAACVCAAAGLWRRCLAVLFLCLVAALSMLVYLPKIAAYRAGILSSTYHLTWSSISANAAAALCGECGAGNTAPRMLWALLLSGAAISLSVQSASHFLHDDGGKNELSMALYGLIALSVGSAAGLAFMKINAMFPMAWHFIPFIALAGVIVDMGIRSPCGAAWASIFRAVLACLVAILSLRPLWNDAHLRRTNLDLIAKAVAQQAGPGDLVLVSPFWLSPGFERHYHGAARWTILPTMDDNIQDPMLKLMQEQDGALEPTRTLIQRTLAKGHRLWVAGNFLFLLPDEPPPRLPPVPLSPADDRSNTTWAEAWMLQTSYFLRTHALQARIVPVPVPNPVGPLENESLYAFTGWR